jgi:hypothetical protein
MKENRVCQSCETLKEQLDRANYENQRLLDKLVFTEPKVEISSKPVEVPIRNIPWHVRRQMLEAEDRERARLMREAPKPIPVEDLEKEMEIAEETRTQTIS